MIGFGASRQMAWFRAYALLALLVSRIDAKKDLPSVKATSFSSPPSGVYYFEDTDIVLATDPEKLTVYRSKDSGENWKPLDGPDEGDIIQVLTHPYDKKTAVVLGRKKKHWISVDKGETWKSFTTPVPPAMHRPAINFHASDSKRMLFLASNCLGFDCEDSVYYTTDGFASNPKLLREDTVTCQWAKSTPLFTTGDEKLDSDQILCVTQGASFFNNDNELRISSDFFKTKGKEPAMADGSAVKGIINLAAVKSYMVAAAKSAGTTELAMYVSDDTKTWHRAEFGEHKLEEDAYTLLESTSYSMQVDVMTTRPTKPMGVLLTSNSNGTFFRKNVEHTNRNAQGFVDFEGVQDIQGIALVNTVDNWQDVQKNYKTEKKIKSAISFDDGRTWQALKAGDKHLHLHSVTEQRNSGRIYSSQAPGIIMGVGNTGDYLDDWDEGDTYLSDDAGLTWRRTLSKPHLYEFGDKGGILVAIEDKVTNVIKYSLNHGKDWVDVKLKDLGIDDKIEPIQLTTTPDSTSLKFILTASQGPKKEHYWVYAFDFEDLHERTCKDDDFEDWHARVDEDGNPTCIMGHTQTYRRRKADRKCFVNEEFKDPVAVKKDCKCIETDYECDHEAGFAWSAEEKKCKSHGHIPIPDGKCKKEGDKYMGSSGYKLIPGNTCIKKGGVDLEEPVERSCGDSKSPVASGKIGVEITTFEGQKFVEYYYLERGATAQGDDETVLLRTDRKEVFISRDHGRKWARIVEDDDVVAIYPHQYINDIVYFITSKRKVYYSQNRGKDIHHFDAPEEPHRNLQILQFHPTKKDWIIWTGVKDDQAIAHVSKKGGDDWDVLLKSIRKCQFVASETRQGSADIIFCEQHEKEDPKAPLVLISSNDTFETKTELKKDVVNFATMAEYIVVAVEDEENKKYMRVDTSIDAKVFAEAKFPHGFQVEHSQAYTVLDSSTHAVFLHVTIQNDRGHEYGSIIKSNSNGTSYVLSVDHVNRNEQGYVDFEKMQGLEGIAVVNRVANVKEVDKGSAKKLQTYITHNDGADWALLKRPEREPEEGKFSCSSSDRNCALHLHGYTKRRDVRDTYSSPSAVGIMMAIGNVGEFLGEKGDKDTYTFLTNDGGISWNAIASGSWQWEFGDQGSILVIVKEGEPTKEIKYSLDEGRSWKTFQFSDTNMMVDDISTVPSDTSRMFLLWGKIDGELKTVHLDFRELEERHELCKLDDTHETEDYQLWSPHHPLMDDDCLFGHVAEYYRKKTDRGCYNGQRKDLQTYHNIARNCTCRREDFECDYNFEKKGDGTCQLVAGLSPLDPADACKKDPDLREYSSITGYRKIPLSTCQYGKELDYTSVTHACPNHEEEFERAHGISAAGLFFAITIPIAAAVGVGYWIYNKWDGKFGQIQLGNEGAAWGNGRGSAFDRDAPWIKYPVIALSGVIAVLAALPMLAGSIWNAVSGRLGGRRSSGYTRPFTSRSSFQRGRGNYTSVDEDEGELLGDDSDDEV